MTAVEWIYLVGVMVTSAMVGAVCFRLGMAYERSKRNGACNGRHWTEYVDNDELSW